MNEKYKYLAKADYKHMWKNRGKIIHVYPETAGLFKQPPKRGCSKCKKKRIARGILTKIMELSSEGRDLTLLKGVLPDGLLKLL